MSGSDKPRGFAQRVAEIEPFRDGYLLVDEIYHGPGYDAPTPSVLEEHGVALTPGVDFGHYRANEHLRFSYTTGMDRMELAIERLARVLG